MMANCYVQQRPLVVTGITKWRLSPNRAGAERGAGAQLAVCGAGAMPEEGGKFNRLHK